LSKMVKEKKKEDIQQEKQAEQFLLLMEWLENASYEHYEISNFAKPGFRSRHNSSYWQGKKYLGLGPSAHSFNGESRQWNISNNKTYTESLEKNEISFESEILTQSQKANEYIMTSLRTMEGLDLEWFRNSEFGVGSQELRVKSQKFIESGKLTLKENKLLLTREGKLFADGIAADLFIDAV
jgi:oxygen-independent coproporphyrinogen III oxidase